MSLYLLDWFKFPSYGEVNFFRCREEEYTWQVPVGVTSISAVLIGGGASGGAGIGQRQSSGGGGGGLRFINGMPVVPGEILKIKVGCGGTGQFSGTFDGDGLLTTSGITENGGDGWDGNNGVDSYIASDNNSLVPQRSSLPTRIICFAGGGRRGRVRRFNNQGEPGGIGGTGSLLGSYNWGTIGGGNGGIGGTAFNTGGASDGGGGGAAGWVSDPSGDEYDLNYVGEGEPTGGFGGSYPSSNNEKYPGNGKNGGGGGGVFTGGGNSNCGGGGGGVGIVWGRGPNGLGGGQYARTTNTISAGYNLGGQAGSYGADGKSAGNLNDEYVLTAAGTNPRVVSLDIDGTTTTAPADPGDVTVSPFFWNYSIGNGVRGYDDDLGDETLGLNGGYRLGGGGQFGGGGGGADASGSGGVPKSGPGGDGAVRIIFAARTTNTRNYPDNNLINNANILTDYGYYDDAAGPPARAGVGTATVTDPVGFTT